MGEMATLNDQLASKIFPIRKYVVFASAVFICLSLLIVIESAFILTAHGTTSSPLVVVFSYLLAWLLVVFGLVGLKYACMSGSATQPATVTVERRESGPIWISGTLTHPGPELSLPGSVPFATAAGFPPPPPRYSSLGLYQPEPYKPSRVTRSACLIRSPPPIYPRNSIV